MAMANTVAGIPAEFDSKLQELGIRTQGKILHSVMSSNGLRIVFP